LFAGRAPDYSRGLAASPGGSWPPQDRTLRVRGGRHRPRAGRGRPKGGPTARPKRRLTAEEREERRRRDRERLERATRELLSSEGWKRWLRARATFHSYSLHNTLLIASQARALGFEATCVAGFKAWLHLNRVVRKGEKALRILAPVSVKERNADGEETGERRVFFRTVFVFDTLSRESPEALSGGVGLLAGAELVEATVLGRRSDPEGRGGGPTPGCASHCRGGAAPS
jgi:N-terminal domain of anti-restriction factor ArdC